MKLLILFIILIILALFLLSYYYKTSSLYLDSKGITLKVKKKKVIFDNQILATKPIVFSNVNIMQSSLSDGTYYEVARCEPLYEFNQNIKKIVMALFEAKHVDELFSIRGLWAMRVTLENGQVINLFMDDHDRKELKFFYGIPHEEFYATVKKIMGKDFKEFPMGGLFELPIPMTKWNVIHNDFEGIISSIDY